MLVYHADCVLGSDCNRLQKGLKSIPDMTTIVQHDNLAAIPAEIASAFGISEGTRLEWTDAGGGMIAVKPLPSRGERARALLGAGRQWLKPGDDPLGDLIEERVAEDSGDDASARHLGTAGPPPR